MRRLFLFLATLWLAFAPTFTPAAAMSPSQLITITPAYQAPGWTGWTPLSIGAAVKAFWSADDHGTANMTDDGAGLISAWVDKAGSMSVTATTTARPTWSATAITVPSSGKTLAALVFNGTATGLTSTTLTTLPTGATAGEIWIGLNQTVADADAGIRKAVAYGTGSDTSRVVFRTQNTSANSLRIDNGNSGILDRPGAFAGQHVVRGVFSGTTINGYMDGKLTVPPVATVVTLNTGTIRFRIGARHEDASPSLHFWSGGLRHIVITTALSDAQAQILLAWYLWDMDMPYMLPPNHPYRYRRP
jgi:hypothetical protein